MNDIVVSRYLNSTKKIGIELSKVEVSTLKNGDPRVFLKCLNFLFVEYSPEFYLFLLKEGFPLQSMNDYKFVQSLFQIIVD